MRQDENSVPADFMSVLMMSDGFPEMFNEQNQMLGFDKAAEVLREIADLAPQEIINHFVEVIHKWADTRPADDDVTFVVMKITPSFEAAGRQTRKAR